MKITIFIDPDDEEKPDIEVVAETTHELNEVIAQIMDSGIVDEANRVWYPPHQVKRIEYASS